MAMPQNYKTFGQLDNLTGTPQYDGMEYDYEVPDHIVAGSPGGVSSTHHHWTKGFYGNGGGASYDHFGHSNPHHPYGSYGGMYNAGQTASQQMGYYPQDTGPQWWKNQTPPSPFEGFQNGSETMTGDADIEFIEPSDDEPTVEKFTSVSSPTSGKTGINSAVLLYIVFILAFISSDFWATAIHDFVEKKLHKGEKYSWKMAVFHALAMTALFILSIYILKIPLTTFEKI